MRRIYTSSPVPGAQTPPADAKIAWVSHDPVRSRFKTMEFRADLWMSVVFVNASYSTGTQGLRCSYPGGYAETVSETAQVGPALARGLEQVRKGYPAVIGVRIPSPV